MAVYILELVARETPVEAVLHLVERHIAIVVGVILLEDALHLVPHSLWVLGDVLVPFVLSSREEPLLHLQAVHHAQRYHLTSHAGPQPIKH